MMRLLTIAAGISMLTLGWCGLSWAQNGVPARSVLFVIAAGEEGDTFAENMKQAIEDSSASRSMRVETVEWARYETAGENFGDFEGHALAAYRLAERINYIKKVSPGTRVYLMGFSAGTQVALLTAERLTPNSLERIILLAPSTSNYYNLAPALRASRMGLDNFFSTEDLVLQNFEVTQGTSDGQKTMTAGRIGFAPNQHAFAAAPDLGKKLRQYRWGESYHRYHHLGDHLGWNRIPFMNSVLIPMVAPVQE